MNSIMNEDKKRLVRLVHVFYPHATIYLIKPEEQENGPIRLAIDAQEIIPIDIKGMLIEMMDALNIPHFIKITDLADLDESEKQSILQRSIVWNTHI